MQYKGKRLVIINLHRVPRASLKAKGICSSLTQYHLSDRKAKTANEYRKEIFKEIKTTHIKIIIVTT